MDKKIKIYKYIKTHSIYSIFVQLSLIFQELKKHDH